MGFDAPSGAYGRFMGRYSEPLAVPFARFAEARSGQRLLDVGSGPGALTAHLCSLTEPALVTAVDPSPSFVAALVRRCPEANACRAVAEALPFPDRIFDAALAELVVHFMGDPVAGLREMARVCTPGSRVAACVWDGPTGALGPFWDAARDLDPTAEDESGLAGAREGHLAALFTAAGLVAVESTALTVEVAHPSFEEWWEPYTWGIGPAGDHVSRLGAHDRKLLADAARRELGSGPFTVSATAWAARGVVADAARIS